jgi:hypothetical protein
VAAHGRLLHAKHLFPYLFAPWFQFRRILLRLDWALFAPLRIASLWTASAVCGVIGVIGSILLFLFNAPPTTLEASTAQTVIREQIAITIPTELGPAVPFMPAPTPASVSRPVVNSWAELQTQLVKTSLPYQWNQREVVTLVSQPTPIPFSNSPYQRDSWFTLNPARRPLNYADQIQAYIHRPGLLASALNPGFTATDTVTPEQAAPASRTPTVVVRRENEGNASLNHESRYSLLISNPGIELIESTIVEERLSAIQRVVDTNPPASLSPDGGALQWNVANLRPGEQRRIVITLVPDTSDVIRHDTLVTLTSRVAAQTSVRPPFIPVENPLPPPREAPKSISIVPEPRIPEPPKKAILALDLEQPTQVKIGEDVRAFYIVQNIGNAPAVDVVTHVTISNQLDHRYGEFLEHRIDRLEPGDGRKIRFLAVGARPGVAALTSQLSASNAEPVARVYEIAVADLDNRSVQPANSGSNSSFPQGTVGNRGNSTVPPATRFDRDDTLPSRVQTTVPGSRASEQLGPMTSPYGAAPPFDANPAGAPVFNDPPPSTIIDAPRTRPQGRTAPFDDPAITNPQPQWRPGSSTPGMIPSQPANTGPSTIPDHQHSRPRPDDDSLIRPEKTVLPPKQSGVPSTLPTGPEELTDPNWRTSPFSSPQQPAVPKSSIPFNAEPTPAPFNSPNPIGNRFVSPPTDPALNGGEMNSIPSGRDRGPGGVVVPFPPIEGPLKTDSPTPFEPTPALPEGRPTAPPGRDRPGSRFVPPTDSSSAPYVDPFAPTVPSSSIPGRPGRFSGDAAITDPPVYGPMPITTPSTIPGSGSSLPMPPFVPFGDLLPSNPNSTVPTPTAPAEDLFAPPFPAQPQPSLGGEQKAI